MRKFFILLLYIYLVSCKQQPSTEDNDIFELKNIPKEGLVLNKWYAVGPFPENGEPGFIDTNNLELVGLSEDDFDFNQFIQIKSKQGGAGKPCCIARKTFSWPTGPV